ncbi:hypothetical protein ACTQ56_02395 [[Clostridium] aminophilum]|uniref:hypothetical protein n=1 Tax=[Clostridium] aminophilum TaxID=1526 RepID=UPI003F9EB17B
MDQLPGYDFLLFGDDHRFKMGHVEYSGVIYTANPDVETVDSGKTETDIPA